MALLDEDGHPALVGRSLGRWLEEADFVFCGEDHAHDEAADIGRHSFPRDWPDVYEESEVLRSMLRKKGPCAAKRVSVVPNVGADHQHLSEGMDLRWLQSLANAEAVKRKTGLAIIEGWAIYDLLDDVTGAAFAGERYWWNATSDGTWLDFTPRAENVHQLLLVEALTPRPPKKPCTLTRRQHALAEHLLELRCPKARAAVLAGAKAGQPGLTAGAEDAPPAAPPVDTNELRTAVKRVKLGITDPLYQLLKRVDDDAVLCEGLVQNGMCGALVGQLSNKHAATAVHILAALTSAAVHGGFHKRASDSLLAAEGVEPLVEMLSSQEGNARSDAARSLANACFQCTSVQERAAKKGAIRITIKLLNRGQQDGLAELAYVLWHLQVANNKNANSALTEGAVTALLPFLCNQGIDFRAQVNILGAMMPLATVQAAQDELGEAGAVPVLCALLSDEQRLQIRGQAAGTLMNLLSGHDGNCKQAVEEGIVQPLVAVIRAGLGPAREYAAGALANLVARGGPEVGPAAVEAGAFEALAGQLQVPRSKVEVFATLANLVKHLSADQSHLLEADLIENVVMAMADEEDVARCQAVTLCMNLAPHVPIKARLLQAGAVKPLTDLLENTEENLRERAAGALANLVDGHTETAAQVMLEAPDLAKKLVYALETEYCGRIQRQMARAIALLASRRPALVRKAGGVEPVAAALEELEDERAWEPALGLMNLAPSGKEREELIDRGTISRLVKLLGDPEARSYAVGALANLTAGSERATGAAITAGAVGSLLALLLELEVEACADGALAHTREALEWTVGALGNVAEYGGTAVRARLAQGGAIAPMVRLLSEGQDKGQELALFALVALQDHQERELQAHLMEAIGPLQNLTARLRAGRLRERGLSLLRLMK